MSFMRSKKKTMRSLRFALKKRNVELVRDVLRFRPKLRTPEGGQLLWGVIDNPEIASMLVLAGADLSERNPIDKTSFLLYVASKVDNVQYLYLALLMLERGANINFRNKSGNTALHLAAKSVSMPFVQALVKKGLSVDITNVDDETAICIAAKSSRATEMLRLLVDQEPVDGKKRNKRILDAIQFFICSDNNEIVAIAELLNLGVDINERSECGLTPLSLAVARGKSNLLELLLEFGSDMNKLMMESNLPVIRASYMEQSLIMNLLLDQGASINVCDEYGRNRLHIVCACSKFMPLRNLQLLLHLGADVNTFDSWGNTPFSLMDAESFNDSRQFYIKHLALLFWKGAVVNDNDMMLVRNDSNANKLFDDCLDELQKMKTTLLYTDYSVFDFFVKSLNKLSLLAINTDFIATYNDKKYLFPMYLQNLDIMFNKAEIRRDMLRSIEAIVRSVTNGILPIRAVERIAYYVCLEKLLILEKEFYFSLYARTNATKLFDDNMVVD